MRAVRWAVIPTVLALAGLVPGPVQAQVVFEGPTYASQQILPGESVVVELPIANEGSSDLTVDFGGQGQFSSSIGYVLERASACPLPRPNHFEPAVLITLRAGERLECAYRVRRPSGVSSDVAYRFTLGPEGASRNSDWLTLAVGDLGQLHTQFTPVGSARREGERWLHTGDWRVDNVGATGVQSFAYSTCVLFEHTRVRSVSPPCTIDTTLSCGFLGASSLAVRFGALSAGDSRSCRVELESVHADLSMTLSPGTLLKAQGGSMSLIDPPAARLQISGGPASEPAVVPAQDHWAKLLLVLLVLLAAPWMLRVRSGD